jgi:hypothetical protein
VIEHHTQPAEAPEPATGDAKGRGTKRSRGGAARSRRPARVELE